MSLPVHVINLDRVPERAAFMQAQCGQAGFDDIRRFSAVDAATMAPSPRYRPARWGAYWSLLPSEVAVFESHRALWEAIAESGRPAVVLEDDVLLSRDTARLCEVLAASAERFDMVKLDALSWPLRLGRETVVGDAVLRPLDGVVPSAAAYLLSPSGARLLLRRSRAYCDHLDDFITRRHPGYRAFQLVPAVAMQAMFADPSGLTGVPQSIAGSERTSAAPRARAPKGPALYRLGKEIGRGARRLARRLWRDRLLQARGGHVGEVPPASDLPRYRT